jgi:outer membrane receptor protein involved in Fe transport
MKSLLRLIQKSVPALALTTLLSGAAFAQVPALPGGGQRPQQPATPPGTANEPAVRGTGKITGFVVDSSVTKAVEFASVALYDKATNKAIDGTVADEKGKFTLNRVAEGEFKILISFLGFSTKTIENVKLEKGQNLDLGVIKLSPNVKTLNEVTVTGQAALVEEKVDRLVYNADKDIAAKGGDATEILRKVPLLSVDLDGNVQLRGNSNIRVLINNKPSTIVAQSVADALKQIPADQIKTVEVITSPSARYDAEGSGGIINIITKKNTLQGLTLNVDAGVGNRGANLGLNGNYRRKKMGFSLGGFGRANYNVLGTFTNVQTSQSADGTVNKTYQNASTRNSGMFGSYSLGWDYDLSKNQSLSANVRYGARNQNNTQFLRTQRFENDLPKLPNYRDVTTKDLSGTWDLNVDYLRTFKPQQEWSISAQYSRNNRTNDFVADLLNDSQALTGRQKNDNDSYNQEITVQTDYQTPITKNQLIEFGGKGIFRQAESDFAYFISTGEGPYALDPTRPANLLDYDQNVAAGYLSYQVSTTNKWNFKVGSRYEYTAINAAFAEGGKIPLANYGNLVPSVNISKNIKGRVYKLSYNRRLQRPGIRSLNPNLNLANPQNVEIGNPALVPELTNNVELGTSVNVKSLYLNISTFYRYTGNSIEDVRTTVEQARILFPDLDLSGVLPTAVVTTSQNIGQVSSYGLNVYGNLNLTPRWSINGSTDVYYQQLTNTGAAAVAATNGGVVVSGRLGTNATFKNGWAIQGFSFFRGRRVQLQGTEGGFGFYSLGVRKDLGKDKRGGIGFAAENFLNFNGFRRVNSFDSPAFTQRSVNTFFNTGFRLTFNYRIGKMSFNEQPRRRGRGVNNDDIKDNGGGDNQPQQQTQPTGGAPGGGRPGGTGGGRPGGMGGGRPR